MSCSPCQYAVNVLLALDKLANALLGGSPNETLSRRLGRAEDAGSRAAGAVCWLLGLLARRHCWWSEQPGTAGREIWPWSPGYTEPLLVPNNPPVVAAGTQETAHG